MTIVTEDIDFPSGANPTNIVVIWDLIGDYGAPLTEGHVGGTTIVGRHTPTVAVDGTYTINLPGNSTISPTGTAWRRTIRQIAGRALTSTQAVDVPATGGPYAVGDIVTEPPTSTVSPALQEHLADTTNAHDSESIGYTGTAVTALNMEQAIAALSNRIVGVPDGDWPPASPEPDTLYLRLAP